MNASRLLAVVVFAATALVVPKAANAMGGVDVTPPAEPSQSARPDHKNSQTSGKKNKAKQKHSSAEDFLNGYRAAYALIYDKEDYEGAIVALHALGHDEHPDVATLLGYASRKLGRYDEAKLWYDRALEADPNHAVTWSYYGMWHAEQGNVLKAKDDLEKVRAICGNTECREYRALKAAIDGAVTY
jgi:tetratricopeptide (TPR) repeat protein